MRFAMTPIVEFKHDQPGTPCQLFGVQRYRSLCPRTREATNRADERRMGEQVVSEKEEEEQEEDEDDDEEQQIFTAAQILCGNLDDSLHGKRRGEAILDLLLRPSSLVDEEDVTPPVTVSVVVRPDPTRSNKRIKTTAPSRNVVEEPPQQHVVWPLERTRSVIRAFHQTATQQERSSLSSSQERPLALTQCWLDRMLPSSGRTGSRSGGGGAGTITTVEHQQGDQLLATTQPILLPLPPFHSFFRNALISMAHLDIAAGLMDQSWDAKGNFVVGVQQQEAAAAAEDITLRDDNVVRPNRTNRNSNSSNSSIGHIASALDYWPTNPSALLLAANVDRMRGGTNHLESALALYRAAMKCAHVTLYRLAQQEVLAEQQHDDEDDEDNDDDDDDDDDKDDGDDNDRFSNDEKFLAETVLGQSAQEDDDGVSQVLVTASYMSALLASCLGRHDVAADALRNFSSRDDPVTRIHPTVWNVGLQLNQPVNTQHSGEGNNDNLVITASVNTITHGSFCPCVFPDSISPELLDVLRFAFRSDGPYWKESGYDRNVYYSFWTDYPLPRPPSSSSSSSLDDNNDDQENCCVVANAIEHYVVEHLLPRVRSVVAAATANNNAGQQQQPVLGFEWWAHTRPHGANLGHQLHFDTDEALLEQDGTVKTPIAATVTYLTLDEDQVSYGATLLFDQTPQSKTNAEQAYICYPQSRSLLVFPGDLLHGVLPCTSPQHVDEYKRIDNDDSSSSAGREFQRLTFMVNFWDYRIPDRITNRPLYGPSGPLPAATTDHTWVQDICRGYPRTIPLPSSDTIPIPTPNRNGLVAVSPAWDTISSGTSHDVIGADEWSVSLPSPLTLPASGTIQQRFFVTNAPDYFHSTLLEK
jgi:hypothetical protein